ncbi:exonuclease [Morganella phage vB_Mm5]
MQQEEKNVDGIIDFETLGLCPHGMIVDMAFIPFVDNPNEKPNFKNLIAGGKRYKFEISSQRGIRPSDAGTVKWWTQQSHEARMNLKPSHEDIHFIQATERILKDMEAAGINRTMSLLYCRGMSYDFPILTDLIRQAYNKDDVMHLEPVMFYRQRDMRTAIENITMTRFQEYVPLPNGSLDGFVMHNSIHDCAKDIMMLQYAKRYALGLEKVPEPGNVDPLSLPKR